MRLNDENNGSNELSSNIERIATRLAEAGLNTEKFINLRSGGKKSFVQHTNKKYHNIHSDISGNYGVYAGDGLLFLDFDDYTRGTSISKPLRQLPATFTVESPHGGEHRYYCCDPDIDSTFKELFGIKNPGMSSGEVRVHNQYVVGPGSVLTECDKSWHDCSKPDEGHYRIKSDCQIKNISEEVLLEALKSDSDIKERIESTQKPKLTPSTPTCEEMDLEEDLEKCLAIDPRLQELWRWACGYRPPATVGFPGDRSKAEVALASKLWYWLADRDAVYAAMEKANPPRWATERPKYRSNVIEVADNGIYREFIPDDIDGGGGGILQETLITIIDALIRSNGKARTEEITELDSVRVEKRQVQNGLAELKKMGYVNDKRQGLYSYWVADTTDLFAFYENEQEYFEALTTADEWAAQQANHLNNA